MCRVCMADSPKHYLLHITIVYDASLDEFLPLLSHDSEKGERENQSKSTDQGHSRSILALPGVTRAASCQYDIKRGR